MLQAAKVESMFLPAFTLKPRSILQLTITGFLAVAGILIVALVMSARQITNLGNSSQRVLTQSAEGMEAVRLLIAQSTGMERNARQYQVVADTDYLSAYRERQRGFVTAVERLLALGLDPMFTDELQALQALETRSYQELQTSPNRPSVQVNYQALRERAYGLSDQLGTWTSNQLAQIQTDSANTQRLLQGQAVGLTLLALGLAALFTRLITRPLGQLEKAINRLGSGSYETEVAVEGPADLRKLGTSLDWLRSRLQKLEQQRTSFFRHVSHELKTPLASIQESVALLRDGVAGRVNAEQLKLLAIHNNNCLRLQGLIDELLRYHKEIQSVLNVVPIPVQLHEVIEQVVAAHEFVLSSAQVRVEQRCEKFAVLGDVEQLRVIVDNLLTNAIKFSPDQGTIFISWQQQEGRGVLDVEDQGPGIAPTEQERIFQAFYRGATPARTLIKSTGLGLAIVQEYVEANRGSIEVVACATGAKFRVSFPL
jgi:two-component system, NtrC family, sensor histidine kinase GlrK